MKLSIVAPWRKSAASVIPFYDRSLAACEKMPEFDEIEFVFVEDGGVAFLLACQEALRRRSGVAPGFRIPARDEFNGSNRRRL
ncbi:MAG: hypothetical protein K2H64_05630 [Desulfovibrio sp.]|nr:hypothetical protein [Desulfovibrio sp.]